MISSVQCLRSSAYEMAEEEHDEAQQEHERLVAYVHAQTERRAPRAGVWLEHSYARARGSSLERAARTVHVLLATAAPPSPPEMLDVEDLDPPLPDPPDAVLEPCDPDTEGGLNAASAPCADEWETRIVALAPAAAHARLADAALEILRRLRLVRLAGRSGARREETRAAARRLRLALATGWAAAGAAHQRPAAWLHAALHAYLPQELRPLYEDILAELRRLTPKLAERLLAGRPILPASFPAPGVEVGDGGTEPLMLWLRTGRDRLEERWERRLRSVLATRALDVHVPGGAMPPDSWCAAMAGAARGLLADAVAAAGERLVIAGGIGAGAAVCAAALGGATAPRVAGAVLLAPALLTAEGPRDAPDDPLGELRVPILLVVGANAANAWRGGSRAVAAARTSAPRRLVEVRGGDHLLRLGRTVRLRLALPQRALDAAIAEECARWAADLAEGAIALAPEAPRRAGGEKSAEDEEYAHLAMSASSLGQARAIEIVEGRVVSRVSGSTPLALAPPRRTPSATLAPADIMQLPIVFADDEHEPSAGPATGGSPVTVTSGEPRAKFTRVLLAKRGGGAGTGVRRGGSSVRLLSSRE